MSTLKISKKKVRPSRRQRVSHSRSLCSSFRPTVRPFIHALRKELQSSALCGSLKSSIDGKTDKKVSSISSYFSSEREPLPRDTLFISMRSSYRSTLGVQPVDLESGFADLLNSNGVSVLIFNGLVTQYCNLLPTNTTCPELASLQSIFDEVKIMGCTVLYQPLGRYGLANTAQLNGAILVFDNDLASVVGTSTTAAIGIVYTESPPSLAHFVSIGDPWTHTFHRPGNEFDYPYDNFQAMSSTSPACRGCVYTLGNAGFTVSKSYGIIMVKFHLRLRIRV